MKLDAKMAFVIIQKINIVTKTVLFAIKYLIVKISIFVAQKGKYVRNQQIHVKYVM